MNWTKRMADTFWQKQPLDRPLFPDLLWSRPENKRTAGKLLIIGGNLHGFSSVAETFAGVGKAGIGSSRILLPDKLQKTLSKVFPEADFASSTPVGSFSRQAIGQLLESAEWADGVLLAGDFSKNSETAVLLEAFLEKYKELVVLSGDSLDYFLESPTKLLTRQKTVILADLSQLQAIAKNSGRTTPLTHDMGLYELVKALAQWSEEIEAIYITHYQDRVVVAMGGRISTTPVKGAALPELSAFVSVWLLQNPQKKYEAATSAAFDLATNKK